MEVKESIKKGKSVPEDANAPVENMLLNDLGSKIACESLKSMRRDKVCGSIQVFDLVNPKLLTIKTNFGMVEGSDLIKEHDEIIDGVRRFHVVVLRHIKNENMNFKGDKKNGQSSDTISNRTA